MDRTLDLAIVGAGIAGVVALDYARRAGVDALAFERQDGPGGLWRHLPAWQDIQISPHDWSLGDRVTAGPAQPQILAHIEDWADRAGVRDRILAATPVQRARHADGAWTLETPAGTFRAHHLLATGGHERPVVPPVQRVQARVRELHSSALRDPATLAGLRVVVVGGGASAYDLLEQSLLHGAAHIAWVYRGLRWFVPSRKPKHVAGSVRDYARLQMAGLGIAEQNAMLRQDLRARYAKFGLDAILPAQPFDVAHDQLMPGRPLMVERFAELARHPGAVAAIEGDDVVLADGTRLQADLLLWGTGYAFDLGWLEVAGLREARSPQAVSERCGGLFRSLEAPNLYLPGVQLDGIGSATLAYALMARSLMAHIQGRARLDLLPRERHVNHMEMVAYLAERDPESFGPDWQAQWRSLVLETPDDVPYPLP